MNPRPVPAVRPHAQESPLDTAPSPQDGTLPGAIPHQQRPGRYTQVQRGADFTELRRAHRSFAFPLTAAFVGWYLLYVLLSNYAGSLMGRQVAGGLNVAFVLGIGQFATTFLLAWAYARYAAARLDPRAEAVRTQVEEAA
ncbi:DUF485 domain-containing protein [Streptomyces polyrhachis]|uniref:DUF485 domain-containing protein n=1 Tax=Streptomyces polyrhachis TaxID=1282885 RepID=A0ABW2GG36_9ACTN